MSPLALYLSTAYVFVLNFLLCCVIMMRITESNTESCLFSAHSLLIATLNALTSIYYVATSPYSVLEVSMPGAIYWGLSVFFGLSRHLSMISFAMSRIVSLTFSRRMQDTVWSNQVFFFCLLITLLLPLGLVASFLIDHPHIHVENDGSTTWGVRQIRDFYLLSGFLIYGVSIGLCLLGLIFALLRTKFSGCLGSVNRRLSSSEITIDNFLTDDTDDLSDEFNLPYGIVALLLLLAHSVEFAVTREMALRYDSLSFSLTLTTSSIFPLCLLVFWRWKKMQYEVMYSSAPFYRGIRYIRKRLFALFTLNHRAEMETPISFIYNVQSQRV
ncbi:hypothetical protein PMAYCL1PPCAC_01674, partial [Pristionchus mayeri]